MNIYEHHYLGGLTFCCMAIHPVFVNTTNYALCLPIVPRVIVELRNPVDGEREVITVGDTQGLTLSSTSHRLVCTLHTIHWQRMVVMWERGLVHE